MPTPLNRPRPPCEPPWHPLIAAGITLFLLPLAGALVVMVNLVRLGQPGKALFALLVGLGSTALILGLWSSSSSGADRGLLLLLLLSAGDSGLFLYLQWPDYRAWRRRAATPAADNWLAAAWGLFGFIAFLILWSGWAVVLGLMAH